MKVYPHWGSHLPILIKIVQKTRGRVLELGMGIFSTPVLHWLCYPNRELVSYEQDLGYLNLFRHFNTDFHKVLYARYWNEIPIERPWDVVLVDHNDDRRVAEILRLADWANYIIVHDTDLSTDTHYHYSKIFPKFKYRKDFRDVINNVSVVSNFIDVRKL